MGLNQILSKTVFGILAGFILALHVLAATDARAQGFAYVTNTNDNTVSVIDTSTNMVVDTIPVGTGPFGISVTSDGSVAYITNQVSGNVSVINTSTNMVVDTIPVGTGPFGIAVTPDGSVAYVTNQVSVNVSVINTSTNMVIDTIPLGVLLGFIDFTPDGLFAYVPSDDETVSVIDASTNMVVDTISVGTTPVGIDFTPDGLFAYVTSQASGNVLLINTLTNMVVDTIPVGTQPGLIAITPDGLFAYVTNSDNAVSVIDTSTNMAVDTIPVGDTPIGIALTPDGLFAYVTNNNDNTVSVIDTSTNMVVDTIPVGAGPFGIALGPPVVEVNITKLTVPGGGTGFSFTSTGFTELFNCNITNTFILDDLETTSCAVAPGDYTITEDIAEGQVLTISCTELPETFSVDSFTGTLEFTIANGGDNVDCTFVNTFAGTVVRVLAEPPGINCEFGGTKIESGFDLNQNGVLEDEEVVPEDTTFVCNGEPGEEGESGALLRITEEPAGENCEFGGQKIETGIDANENGILDDDEVTEEAFVCNGEPGEEGGQGPQGPVGPEGPQGEDPVNPKIDLTDIPPGADCINGGVRIDTGLDLNRNGVLDPEEITDSSFICNRSNEDNDSSNGCSSSLAGPGQMSDLSDLLGLIAFPLIVILGRRLNTRRRAHSVIKK